MSEDCRGDNQHLATPDFFQFMNRHDIHAACTCLLNKVRLKIHISIHALGLISPQQ